MTPFRFRGVYCAWVTPYAADGSVDLARLHDLIAWLLKRGIHGLWVCGGTGGRLSLDEDERRAVAETAVGSARGRAKVIVHVARWPRALRPRWPPTPRRSAPIASPASRLFTGTWTMTPLSLTTWMWQLQRAIGRSAAQVDELRHALKDF